MRGEGVQCRVRRRVVGLPGVADHPGDRGEQDERGEVAVAGQLVQVPGGVHLGPQHLGETLRGQGGQHPVGHHPGRVHHGGERVLGGDGVSTRARASRSAASQRHRPAPVAPSSASSAGRVRGVAAPATSTSRRTPCRVTNRRATSHPAPRCHRRPAPSASGSNRGSLRCRGRPRQPGHPRSAPRAAPAAAPRWRTAAATSAVDSAVPRCPAARTGPGVLGPGQPAPGPTAAPVGRVEPTGRSPPAPTGCPAGPSALPSRRSSPATATVRSRVRATTSAGSGRSAYRGNPTVRPTVTTAPPPVPAATGMSRTVYRSAGSAARHVPDAVPRRPAGPCRRSA